MRRTDRGDKWVIWLEDWAADTAQTGQVKQVLSDGREANRHSDGGTCFETQNLLKERGGLVTAMCSEKKYLHTLGVAAKA